MKKQLWERDTQPQDEMNCLLPSPHKVSKKLLDFSTSFTNAMEADRVLRLPEGVFFLGKPSLGSKLYIRECYETMSRIIFELVTRHGKRAIVISGTPGTGKSLFALYLLYQLRLQSNTVVVQSKGLWYRFSDQERVEKGSFETFDAALYFDDENAWFLCDPVDEQGVFQGFSGVTVVTISPNYDQIHDFLKQTGATQRYMEMWTPYELKHCRKLLYPHVSEDDVKHAYEHVGGAAREAFSKDSLAIKMEMMKKRANEVGVQEMRDAVEADSSTVVPTKKLGDNLFNIHPVDRIDFTTYELKFASSYYADMTMEALKRRAMPFTPGGGIGLPPST